MSSLAIDKYDNWKAKRRRTPPKVKVREEAEVIEESRLLIQELIDIRPDCKTEKDVLKIKEVLKELSVSYLRQSKAFKELVEEGWYKKVGWKVPEI